MKVLLALDDSHYSKHMLELVSRRHWAPDTQFKIVHVVEPVDLGDFRGNGWMEMQQDIEERRKVSAEKLCEDARHKLEKSVPESIVHFEIRKGRPHVEILLAAAEWDANRILVGAHSREVCPHNLLGSVSRAIAERAQCSVEVIRTQLAPVKQEKTTALSASKTK